jgi:hypothetical protein
VWLNGTQKEQNAQRALFEGRKNAWESWWSKHWQELVTAEELETVNLAKHDVDLVEETGLDKFGPLFPTGKGVQLTPVREVALDPVSYTNGRSYVDFDTGRTFECLERTVAAKSGAANEHEWSVHAGIDARSIGMIEGNDLHAWMVDNSRWDTLDDELRDGQPLKLGPEETHLRDEQLGTFLFTTREGGRGIVQVLPHDAISDTTRLKYRMFASDAVEQDQEPSAAIREKGGTPFGDPVLTGLKARGPGTKFLFNLKAGTKHSAPDELVRPADSNAPSFGEDDAFNQWCRRHGIDLAARAPSGVAGGGGPPLPAPPNGLELDGLDMVALLVVPSAFDEMTVEDVRDLIGRYPQEERNIAWMSRWSEVRRKPSTYAFKTRDGSLGLLQILESKGDPEAIVFRYRLHATE